MNKNLDKQLIEKYPKIFRDRYADLKETAMCWGFECDDGWNWLIDSLCESVQSYIDSNNVSQFVATQVKEKFGTLRFYGDGGDELIDGMTWLAEHQSETICEKCGESGRLQVSGGNPNGWMKTLCKYCAYALEYKDYPSTEELEKFNKEQETKRNEL